MNSLAATWREILNFPLIKGTGSVFTVQNLLELVVLLTLVFVAEALFRRFFLIGVLERTRLRPAIRFAIRQILRYSLLALGVYLSLQTVGINLTSLAVLAGAIGVGVGFGLQNIVSNFVSGLIILAEQPIALGDRIEVGDVNGRVTEINLRSTTIVTSDNISIIVPNSNLITGAVTNWSHGDPKVRIRLPVGVAYGTDVQKLRALLLEVADPIPEILKTPKPDVFFVGYGDSSLNFELGVWSTAAVDKPVRFKSNLYFAIHKKLEDNGIEIPFPQRDLHLRSGSFVLQNSEPPDRRL